jgi:hypothetical protein
MTMKPEDLSGPALIELVRQAWANALRHSDFTVDDNFFAIGGNSMAAVRVMTRLGTELGVRLQIRLLFDHQTPTALAGAVLAQVRARREAS